MPEINESNVTALVRKVLDYGIDGVPPLTSAKNLAEEYLLDESYSDNARRVRSLINWETSKNFTTGFLTGLGGIVTLPVAVPAALGASWIVQARLSGAIAHIHGHRLHEDRVRTLVLLSLVGDAGKEVLKEFGIQFGRKLAEQGLRKIPGKVLIEVNKKIGFRLLTKAGERGLINLSKGIPVIGGLVGGSFDAAACRVVGRTAVQLFGADGTEH